MKKNVLVFFVFMMVILTVQLVFNIIFYTTYDPANPVDPGEHEEEAIK